MIYLCLSLYATVRTVFVLVAYCFLFEVCIQTLMRRLFRPSFGAYSDLHSV